VPTLSVALQAAESHVDAVAAELVLTAWESIPTDQRTRDTEGELAFVCESLQRGETNWVRERVDRIIETERGQTSC
jgi:hypothetical protein